MSLKIPTEVRTAFRRILRNHPKILEHLKTKSEVNNLTRDELVELADNLGIDFLSELHNEVKFKSYDVFENHNLIAGVPLGKYDDPFSGELMTELKLSALGVDQTLKVKFHYDLTPDWQYLCMNDKRLKYRLASSTVSIEIEVIGEFGWNEKEKKNTFGDREWMKGEGNSGFWPLLEGPITEKMYEEIERKVKKQDSINRKNLGFPPRIE